jgi:hypothetical protein
MTFTVRKAPCSSCPYRRDVPSGVWDASEYDKLPGYDGDIGEQIEAGATGLFFCHRTPGFMCAGWAGCHDTGNLIAYRLHWRLVDMDNLLDYVSPVPLFSSGTEAAAHGMRDVEDPGPEAQAKGEELMRVIARRKA